MTPEYCSWRGMHIRCEGQYLKRGIKVFSEWKGPEGFARFLAHIGRKPDPRMSVDRINNDGDYTPGNVRWATRATQNNNTSATRFVEAHGRRLSVSQWSRETGLSRSTIARRIQRGLSPEEVVCPSN